MSCKYVRVGEGFFEGCGYLGGGVEVSVVKSVVDNH